MSTLPLGGAASRDAGQRRIAPGLAGRGRGFQGASLLLPRCPLVGLGYLHDAATCATRSLVVGDGATRAWYKAGRPLATKDGRVGQGSFGHSGGKRMDEAMSREGDMGAEEVDRGSSGDVCWVYLSCFVCREDPSLARRE